jgi:septal ring factor EnvC (AmiA/AmiB activator)
LGLIAEDVAKVSPDLAVRNAKGEVDAIRFDSINAMLLNEFLKEHKKVEEQQATIVELKATVAQQRQDFQATATQQQKDFQSRFAEQESQIQSLASDIQKVSAQIEMRKPAPRMATNHP